MANFISICSMLSRALTAPFVPGSCIITSCLVAIPLFVLVACVSVLNRLLLHIVLSEPRISLLIGYSYPTIPSPSACVRVEKVSAVLRLAESKISGVLILWYTLSAVYEGGPQRTPMAWRIRVSVLSKGFLSSLPFQDPPSHLTKERDADSCTVYILCAHAV